MSYAFYALLNMARHANNAGRRSGAARPDDPPAGPPATILARVDVTAAQRGHSVAGERAPPTGLASPTPSSCQWLSADELQARSGRAGGLTRDSRPMDGRLPAVRPWSVRGARHRYPVLPVGPRG